MEWGPQADGKAKPSEFEELAEGLEKLETATQDLRGNGEEGVPPPGAG